jgi:hypothetical protein
MGVNEICLRVCREIAWHFESKERLGELCVPSHEVHRLRLYSYRKMQT